MTTQTLQPTPREIETDSPPQINPWLFVPVLYFMQAMPYVLVNETFGSAYKSLGVDNLKIALWTGLAALPWAFKMFWGPLVDLTATKRQWVVVLQVILAVTLAFSAGAMLTRGYFAITIAALFLIATLSATHDIACDGLYLMSLDQRRQAAFSGVMTSCSRIGRLFCASLLVWLAGWLSDFGMNGQRAWATALGFGAFVYGAGMLWNLFALPRPAADVPARDIAPGERRRNIIRTLTVIAFGVALYYLIDSALQLIGYWMSLNVPPGRVPKNWGMTNNEFTRTLYTALACTLLVPLMWTIVRRQLRRTAMGEAFVSYARQRGFIAILAFLLFYRFGEVMVISMAKLFMLGKRDEGGLELSLQQFGAIQGFGQVAGLIVGGLAGGYFVSRVGLRRALWPLVIVMHALNALYVWAAFALPNIASMYVVAFGQAAGYGFGFAGYLYLLMQIANRGHFTTSHYAVGTGLGALFITFATIAAGIVQSVFGYKGVFIAACLLAIPGMLTLLFVPLDAERASSET